MRFSCRKPSRGLWVLSVLLLCVLTAGNAAAVLACGRTDNPEAREPECGTAVTPFPEGKEKTEAAVHTEAGYEDDLTPAESSTEVPDDEGTGSVTAEADPNRYVALPDTVPPAFCDVPLSRGQQLLALSEATRRDLPVSLIYGVMYAESRYTETAVSPDGVSYGIMQINRSNFAWLGETLGLTDFLDYGQNLRAGCYLLALYYQKYGGSVDRTLMCYRYGETGARRAWANGVTTDAYCEIVKKEQERLGV